MTGIRVSCWSRNLTLRIFALVLLVLGLLAVLVGCSDSSASQTQVKQVTAQDDGSTLTALERGEVRREALASVEKGLQAWLDDDAPAMEQYFTDDLVEKYDALRKQYAEEGKRRVRDHEVLFFDVTQMNQDGTQVMVDYRMNDRSHFVDAQAGILNEPSGDEHLIQLTADLQEGDWVISRMFGMEDVLK